MEEAIVAYMEKELLGRYYKVYEPTYLCDIKERDLCDQYNCIKCKKHKITEICIPFCKVCDKKEWPENYWGGSGVNIYPETFLPTRTCSKCGECLDCGLVGFGDRTICFAGPRKVITVGPGAI